jgi:List-Bact-rpt repeat protein/FIMAH domain-containing protein
MNRSARQLSRKSPWLAVALPLLLVGITAFRDAAAANIFVTTTEDEIKDVGDPTNTGCSLKEAIFSANFNDNVAILNYYDFDFFHGTATPFMVRTPCVPGTADGSGADTIILPSGQTLVLRSPADDAANPLGPTATPMISSIITIEGNGATLQGVPLPSNYSNPYFRAFAVGPTGTLVLKNVYIKDFAAKGGNGAAGGGGGLGAGGAIFVREGKLFIDSSTFASNGAQGGRGSGPQGIEGGFGGGGGGMGGDGGVGAQDPCSGTVANISLNAGGGGGSRGFGEAGIACLGAGDGGGSVEFFFDCGGFGGSSDVTVPDLGTPGGSGRCDGGGGGGGQQGDLTSGDGGRGGYGGGGGGGANGGGNGGGGGFGGGGGAGWSGFFGGTGGGGSDFGGGGGAGPDGTAGGGDPGHGGKYGGNASSTYGGGGGALGGAIFSDSGTVAVTNSTFYDNFVDRGEAGGSGADNGADAGGAIFARNGSIRIQNATIAGNRTTGSLGGVVVLEDGLGASFTLENSIIYNNGSDNNRTKECSYTGSVTPNFVNNLIQNNDNCGVEISSDDPLLGPLQNNQGLTPTMAIPQGTASQPSPAWNAGDPVTSLEVDQRGQTRPAMDGFDLGAFELCLDRFGNPCHVVPFGNLNSQTLTMRVSPVGAGTTTPPPGDSAEPENSVVTLTAIANLGYHFLSWSGGVTNPTNTSTTVVMDQPRIVTANFGLRDFSLSTVPSIAIPLGGSSSKTLTVSSLGDFSQLVNLSSSGQPTGVTTSLNPPNVTPAPGGSIPSTYGLGIGPMVTPMTFTLTLTGTSGSLTHSVPVNVTVQPTTDGIIQVIGADLLSQCIDSGGIGNALISKLNAAQAFIDAGDIQSAINTLTALLNQLNAQAAKHIKTACSDALIADVQALLASLGASGLKPNPVMGFAVNSSNVGVSGATVSLINSAKVVVASAVTDATGFYFFANTSVFTKGSSYTVKVAPPKPYKSATSRAFTWTGSAVSVTASVLN